MHLLAATPGEIADGDDPVDPGQTPADIVFLSAADTELALLSQAFAQRSGGPSLRLAQLQWLRHPYAVDLYLEKTAGRARLVIARILGGAGYWRYGLEAFRRELDAAGVAFAALPGDDKPDPELLEASSISSEAWHRLWAYLVEGGAENARGFLDQAAHLLGEGPAPPPARPLLRAGYYRPGHGIAERGAVAADWTPGAPVAALVFYRALLEGAGLDPVDRLAAALRAEGLNPLPLFVASLKDPLSAATLAQAFERDPPAVVLNATAFAVGQAKGTVLDAPGAPVFQVIFSSGSAEAWEGAARGLSPRDIAMSVALPEVDGRILSRAVSFKAEAHRDDATECPVPRYRAEPGRVRFVAALAARWARLRRKPRGEKRVALILANYPNKDGRLANGVGLDTPASAVRVLAALSGAGYAVTDPPADPQALMARLMAGPTNWLTDRAARQDGERLAMPAYRAAFQRLPAPLQAAMLERWGPPEADPFVTEAGFALSLHRFGGVTLGLQPARGYNIDPEATYHAPDLVPPHNYLAFYVWLREVWGADAIVHLGKHGNLEWLPGKAVALSERCWPEAVLGPMPHLYPFIVNDPGEGTQAKRRAQAVIVDHLTPPLTRAESYGPLRDLEGLVDEYYEAAGLDPRRIAHLRGEILALMAATGIDADAGIGAGDDTDSRLSKLDAYLCELKEAQIRDGLHVFGVAPEGRLARDLTLALTRLPRGAGEGAEASLTRAIATDLGLAFDPLDANFAAPWTGPRPARLAALSTDAWRSHGDTVERVERFALALLDGKAEAPGPATRAVLEGIGSGLGPMLAASGQAEMTGLLDGLDGRFVRPGPSGAPSRGRLDVLPTGRNFFSVDSRAIPTRAAWALGWKSASFLIERHLQDEGEWPRALALTAWGTANMRTGGDDIAQALALMGVRPRWDDAARRVVGFEILPLSVLGRPRVDVTLRVSGFFRDAFPAQVDLVASAARAVMALDEPAAENPAAARFRAEGGGEAAAWRVFGSKPGAYGAGLQALIDERGWETKADFAEAYLSWGGFAYGAGAEGADARPALETRLRHADGVVQNQDNREHDLLDSDDYYQFEGGLAASIETLSGRRPRVYHNDHSRPERPVIRTLDDEIGRVVRSRAVNPKWIAGVKRHGYKGAFEMAATLDYLFAFAATTGAVRPHHFDLVAAAYLEDDATRAFIAAHNPPALKEMAARLQEAIDRGLWVPRSNSLRARIEAHL